MRLPLKTIGLHSDEPISPEQDHPDQPVDPPGETDESKLADAPVHDDVGAGEAPPSGTTVVAPVETAILIEIASPEGIQSEAL